MMPLPTRRWLVVAAVMALGWPLADRIAGGVPVWVVVELLWCLAVVVDWLQAPAAGAIDLTREAPAAFSVGHALPIRYRWASTHPRPSRLLVREALPAQLIGARAAVERVIDLPARGTALEILEVMPHHRGRGAGGRI